jgi:hypothetical protein
MTAPAQSASSSEQNRLLLRIQPGVLAWSDRRRRGGQQQLVAGRRRPGSEAGRPRHPRERIQPGVNPRADRLRGPSNAGRRRLAALTRERLSHNPRRVTLSLPPFLQKALVILLLEEVVPEVLRRRHLVSLFDIVKAWARGLLG